ncbi:MAG: hypothetical protein ACE5FN_09750 [Leptospirillia bacterium]
MSRPFPSQLRVCVLALMLPLLAACSGGGDAPVDGGGHALLLDGPPIGLTAPERINEPSGQPLFNPTDMQTAFDAAGNGMAIWEVYGQFGIRVVYALYDAASTTWGEVMPLFTPSSYTYYSDHPVISQVNLVAGTDGFAVAWEDESGVQISVFRSGGQKGSWTFEGNQGLFIDFATQGQSDEPRPGLYPLNDGYALVWGKPVLPPEGGMAVFNTAIYQNGGWTTVADAGLAVPAISLRNDRPFNDPQLALTSNGNRLLQVYMPGSAAKGSGFSVYTRVLEGGAWGPWVEVGTVFDRNTQMIDAAPSGSGFVAAWQSSYVTVSTSRFIGNAWEIPLELERTSFFNMFNIVGGASFGGYLVQDRHALFVVTGAGEAIAPIGLSPNPWIEYGNPVIQTNAQGFRVTWASKDAERVELNRQVFRNGVWEASETLFGMEGSLNHYNHVSWAVAEDGGAAMIWEMDGVIYARQSTDTADQVMGSGPRYNLPLHAGASGDEIHLFWRGTGEGGCRACTVADRGGQWGVVDALTSSGAEGGGSNPHISVNEAGDAVAVWWTHDGITGRIRRGGVWGAQTLLFSHHAYQAHTWKAISDGSRFLVVISTATELLTWVVEGDTWPTPEQHVTNLPPDGEVRAVQVAASPLGFAISWGEYDAYGTRIWKQKTSVFRDGEWDRSLDLGDQRVEALHGFSGGFVLIARGVTAYHYGVDGWGEGVPLSGPGGGFNVQIDSHPDDGGVVVLWQEQLDGGLGRLVTRRYFDGQWSLPSIVSESPRGVILGYGDGFSGGRLAAGPDGHAVIWAWRDPDGVEHRLYGRVLRDGVWSAPDLIENMGWSIPALIHPRAAADGYAVVWGRVKGEQGVFLSAEEGNGWSAPAELRNGDGKGWAPQLESDGRSYLVSWSERAGDHTRLFARKYVPFEGMGPVRRIDHGTGDARGGLPGITVSPAGFTAFWTQADDAGDPIIGQIWSREIQ